MRAAAGARVVAEVPGGGDVPLWVHPEWAERFTWLAQGTTGRGEEAKPFDLGLAGDQPVGAALERWRRLRDALGARTVSHARQVHGAEVFTHEEVGPPGISVMDGLDGHATARAGLLLAVGVADCVPVSLVDPDRRVIALVHSGWRGTAAGITEAALRLLGARWGSDPDALWIHCGPAICGRCYEVGPEVHAAIHPDRSAPASPAPIDVRAAIAERVVSAGAAPERVTLSAHCTRCEGAAFFSHRGGSSGRQMGILGIR